VAAAQAVGRKKFKLLPTQRSQQQQKGQGRHQDASRRPQTQQGGLRMSMCFYHVNYGEWPKYCEEGCVWLEN
jgi:hypothetical protein